MVLLESGENLKEKQTADIRKKFGETIDFFFEILENSLITLEKTIEVSPIESKFPCVKLPKWNLNKIRFVSYVFFTS